MSLGMNTGLVSKFRGENYIQWKFLIRFVMQARGCYDVGFMREKPSEGGKRLEPTDQTK